VRGVPRDPQVRAEAVAAVVAGERITSVARRLGIDDGLLSRWVAADAGVAIRRPVDIGAKLIVLIEAYVDTLLVELQAARDPAWLARSTPADLASLVAVQHDGLIRLLSGIKPIQPSDPELPEPS
jgi:Transposase